jgi:hypothetical protein
MERAFVNPLGVASAVYGILCFALIEVAVLFILPLQVDFNQTIAFGCICIVAVLHYYAVVQDAQTFSPEEQDKFLRTYIYNGKRLISVAADIRFHRHHFVLRFHPRNFAANQMLKKARIKKPPAGTGGGGSSSKNNSTVAVTDTALDCAELNTSGLDLSEPVGKEGKNACSNEIPEEDGNENGRGAVEIAASQDGGKENEYQDQINLQKLDNGVDLECAEVALYKMRVKLDGMEAKQDGRTVWTFYT